MTLRDDTEYENPGNSRELTPCLPSVPQRSYALFSQAPPCRIRTITRTTHYALRPRPEVILLGEVVHANNLFSEETP
jgi:hypothetical protein